MIKKKNFYITTPLYYPNSTLHIGHAYTTVLADVLARYKKMSGYNVFFLVGSDEHGQKIEQTAKKLNKTPLEFVTENVQKFKELWKLLNIDYDQFERTTNKQHEVLCQNVFSQLLAKKYIYKSAYSGLYCKSCEEFLTSAQVNENNNCIVCYNNVESFSEETFFFKVSKFNAFILKLLNGKFLLPFERQKEMINNFVQPGLADLSVTRISFSWGINIHEDKKHILYVWLDALLGYLSGIKYQSDNSFFEKYWGKDTEIVQLIGKEITRFHSIYWPAILKALDLRMPDKLISHGWIIMNDQKMSKSIGNVIDPVLLVQEYGSDAIRYFLAAYLKIDIDNNYNAEILKDYYNSHLVNNYGNLVSRVTKMVLKYFDGKMTNITLNHDSQLLKLIMTSVDKFNTFMDSYDINNANKIVIQLFSYTNKYIEDIKPWTFFENKQEELKIILAELCYVILVGTYLLKPFLVNKSKEVFRQFNLNLDSINLKTIMNLNFCKNINISKGDILFQRK